MGTPTSVAEAPVEGASTQLFYVLGIMPRSGTNYLQDLLCSHPRIERTALTPEDFLLENAHELVRFVRSVQRSWSTLWHGRDPKLGDLLLRAAWSGVEQSFLAQKEESSEPSTTPESNIDGRAAAPRSRITLARTPSVGNLHLLPCLTEEKAVVIVRDGRAVVESGMRSFGWPFEEYLQRWAASSQRIRDTVASHGDQILVVRYEELLQDPVTTTKGVLDFLGIDDDGFEYRSDLPVRGSSALLDQGRFWEPTTTPPGFDPLNRWRHWGSWRRARYEWVAGAESRAWGYPASCGTRRRYVVANRIMDAAWPLRRATRGLARRALPEDVRAQLLWRRGRRYSARVRGRSGGHAAS